MKRSFSLVCCLVLACAAAGLSHTSSDPVLWELSGTVTGFDPQDTQLLSVNTRLGPRTFRVTNTTVYLLNNHGGTAASVTPGDEVTVRFRFDTSTAHVVHVFRETQQQVRVVSVGNNVTNVRLNGATVALRTDANSVIQLGGVPVSNTAVLVGRPVSVIYEPDTLLLLSLAGRAPTMTAKLRTVDATARTVTLTGTPRRTITLDESATIRRGANVVTLDRLRKGDRLTLVLNRRTAGARILALQARRARR